MSAPVQAALVVLGLVVSAVTKLHAVILGQPVTVPALWLALAVIVLALAAAVLVLVRLLIRDGLRLRPVAVNP